MVNSCRIIRDIVIRTHMYFTRISCSLLLTSKSLFIFFLLIIVPPLNATTGSMVLDAANKLIVPIFTISHSIGINDFEFRRNVTTLKNFISSVEGTYAGAEIGKHLTEQTLRSLYPSLSDQQIETLGLMGKIAGASAGGFITNLFFNLNDQERDAGMP